MSAAVQESNTMLKAVLNYVAGALLVVMMAVVGYQQTAIGRLEERQYVLQKDAVSEEKLNAMESRIMASVGRELGYVRNEIKLTNDFLEKVVNRLETNPPR